MVKIVTKHQSSVCVIIFSFVLNASTGHSLIAYHLPGKAPSLKKNDKNVNNFSSCVTHSFHEFVCVCVEKNAVSIFKEEEPKNLE